MEIFERKMISIDDLLVSEENPRIFEARDQMEAMRFILEDQGRKIIELAESMAKGVMASSVMLVAEDDRIPGKYRVYDGNRRLTVLKSARDPSLLEDMFPSEMKRISELSNNLNWSEFYCAVFSDKKDAIAESKKIHSETNKGSGTQPWPPAMIARDSRNDVEPRYLKALLVIDALRDEHIFDENDMKYYYTNAFPFTTLDRVVNTSSVFNLLGLREESRRLVYIAYKAKSIAYMRKLVEELKDGGTSRSFNKKAEIIEFVEKIVSSVDSGGDPPSGGDDKSTGGTGNGGGSDGDTGDGGIKPVDGNGTEGGPSGGGPRPSKFFKTLDWKNKLNTNSANHVPLLKVCCELHDMSSGGKKKNYEKFPVSASILLRSGYEQAVKLLIKFAGLWDEFEEKYKNPREQTLSVMESFVNKNKERMNLSQDIIKGLEHIGRGKYRSLLNDYTHNLDVVSATPSNLEDIAEIGMRGFIQGVINLVGREQ